MKLSFPLLKGNALTFMRSLGYVPEGQDQRTGQLRYTRVLSYARYPRFHAYVSVTPEKDSVGINLHLDQKQPSYQGSSAHAGEYEGEVVEREAQRMRDTAPGH